jgi:hypothetical protein
MQPSSALSGCGYNCATGIATVPSSVIFGALAPFGWGAALAQIAVILLAGVKEEAKPQAQ